MVVEGDNFVDYNLVDYNQVDNQMDYSQVDRYGEELVDNTWEGIADNMDKGSQVDIVDTVDCIVVVVVDRQDFIVVMAYYIVVGFTTQVIVIVVVFVADTSQSVVAGNINFAFVFVVVSVEIVLNVENY